MTSWLLSVQSANDCPWGAHSTNTGVRLLMRMLINAVVGVTLTRSVPLVRVSDVVRVSLGVLVSDVVRVSLGVLLGDGVWLGDIVLVILVVLVIDGVRVVLAVLLGLPVVVAGGVLVILGVYVSLGVLVRDGVLVGEGVVVSLGVLVGDGVVVSLGVLVGDGVMVSSAIEIVVADGIAVSLGIAIAVAVSEGMVVAVAGGTAVTVAVAVAVALSAPIDGAPLMINVAPSGTRAILSLLLSAPKSMRSTWAPLASSNTTASPVLLRIAEVIATANTAWGAMMLPAGMVVWVPPGVSSSMRQPLTSTAVALVL